MMKVGLRVGMYLNNQILKSFTFRFLAKIPYTSFKLQKDIHNRNDIRYREVHLKESTN